MHLVAQHGPDELALIAFGIAQQLQAFGSGLLQHAAIHLVALLAGRHVFVALEVVAQDVAADLLEETGLGLLAQIALLDQLGHHTRRAEVTVERIALLRQVGLHGLDHMRHGVDADHVRGAEGAGAGTAQLLAGQVIHHVVGQAVLLGLDHGAQHAEDADAVGDEVGGVLGAHHALAQHADGKGFQIVQDLRLRARGGN